MLLTTLGFLILTVLFAVRHVKRTEQPATPSGGAPCPRCRAKVPAGSLHCPACGISQQVFEMVTAELSVPDAGESTGALRALVRADMCVGCGSCVAACPEPGAITMRGKLAVVDPVACKGHGECAKACPIGAISMTNGAAVNRVAVPLVDANFESTVPGIYIVGELGGRGLIKNAINEGKLAVEHVGRVLPPARPRADGDASAVDVAIVGSGPAGLSAGLEALRLGLSYVLLEQGSLSDSVRKYPRHKLLLAEPVRIPLYGDLWVADASKETLLQVWETIVANTGLLVRTGEKVERVERDGALFTLHTPNARYRARRVVLAMGRRGSPRRLGVPGEGLPKVFYDIVEMEAFRDRRVLVVGGGDSAVESAVGLANQRGCEVSLSYRGEDFTRVKERNRAKLDRAVAEGCVRLLLRSQVREIRPDVVVLDVAGVAAIVPNDNVVIRVGGEAPHAFLERLGVRIVQKDVPLPAEAARAG